MNNDDILPGFDEQTNDSLTIELQAVEGVSNGLAFKIDGQLDTYSTSFFRRHVNMAIDAGYVNLVFLLDGVDYVSSMGVGAFVKLQEAVREKGGSITLAEAQPKVMKVFRLMCLDRFFACCDSLDDAAALLMGQSPVFPRGIGCPICDRKLRVLTSGRFRCPQCKTILSISQAGAVSLG